MKFTRTHDIYAGQSVQEKFRDKPANLHSALKTIISSEMDQLVQVRFVNFVPRIVLLTTAISLQARIVINEHTMTGR